jgi:hypothetical protein
MIDRSNNSTKPRNTEDSYRLMLLASNLPRPSAGPSPRFNHTGDRKAFADSSHNFSKKPHVRAAQGACGAHSKSSFFFNGPRHAW